MRSFAGDQAPGEAGTQLPGRPGPSYRGGQDPAPGEARTSSRGGCGPVLDSAVPSIDEYWDKRFYELILVSALSTSFAVRQSFDCD